MDIRAECAVRTIVESMLPRWSGKLGLLVSLDVDFCRYNNDGRSGKRIMCDFIFLREMNYTKVFYREWNRVTDRTDQWKLIGDHDSCWIESVDRALQKIRKQADEICQKELGKDTNAGDISFGFCFPGYCLVDYKMNEEDSSTRLGLCTIMHKKVEIWEAVTYMKGAKTPV